MLKNYVSRLQAIFCSRDQSGRDEPERARWAHLARSGSLSEHGIRFILPVRGASHIIKGGTNFLSLWMKPLCVTIPLKATEQYFHVVLFIMLYKVVLTFKSVDETLVRDHSNESY